MLEVLPGAEGLFIMGISLNRIAFITCVVWTRASFIINLIPVIFTIVVSFSMATFTSFIRRDRFIFTRYVSYF